MPTVPTTYRRLMACDRPERVVDDVQGLRRGGYVSLGRWSLPQVCRHLALAIEPALHPPATTEQTPEQAAAFAEMLARLTSPAGLPPGRPTSPAMEPPADCTDADCDRLIAAMRALADYPHSHVTSSRSGPVPIALAVRFHLGHANHHLSFLRPKTARRVELEYPDTAAAVADVARLRKGYVRTGGWNLAQAAHHLAASLAERMRPDTDPPDTPEQLARAPIRDRVLHDNVVANGLTAPPNSAPPADLTDDTDAGRAAVDRLVVELGRLGSYPGPFPPHRLFGRMTREQNVRHQLVHAAHHLSHLVPITEPKES